MFSKEEVFLPVGLERDRDWIEFRSAELGRTPGSANCQFQERRFSVFGIPGIFILPPLNLGDLLTHLIAQRSAKI
jgi:hypothetical protein